MSGCDFEDMMNDLVERAYRFALSIKTPHDLLVEESLRALEADNEYEQNNDEDEGYFSS